MDQVFSKNSQSYYLDILTRSLYEKSNLNLHLNIFINNTITIHKSEEEAFHRAFRYPQILLNYSQYYPKELVFTTESNILQVNIHYSMIILQKKDHFINTKMEYHLCDYLLLVSDHDESMCLFLGFTEQIFLL